MAQHCTPCIDRDREQRVFLREDQIFQHIRGVHLYSDVSKKACQAILSAWKIDNPFINKAAMTCGFCGERLYTWSERSEHVSTHLKSKKCMASWWPERLSIVETRGDPLHMDEPFDCYNCGLHFRDVRVAEKFNSSCVSWSCRNLTDWHAIFDEIPSSPNTAGMLSFACKLCQFTTSAYEKDYESLFLKLEVHARENHFLRQCSQGRFAVLHEFVDHMTLEHGAHTTLDWDALSSWKCRQILKWSATRSLIGTIFHPSVTGLLCDCYGDTQDSAQFEIPLYPV
jgi:predicted small metal-binding protein